MNLEALAARVAALSSARRLRITVAIFGFAVVTLVTVLIARPAMFTGFASFDDEGYMLTALKSFVSGGHLYDQVFTQYGPFYYEAFGGVASVFGITVTHDAGRTMTMVLWVAASLVLGLAMLKITRSIVLGLATQILSFNVLTILAGAQMHPVGIIGLLLGVILVIAAFVRDRESPYAMGLLGMAVASLFLVKINVGAFALISLALACLWSYPTLWRRRWLRVAVEAFIVVLPVLLMTSNLDQGWARHYAAHIALSVAAVVLALEVRAKGERASGDLGWLVGGFVLFIVVSCGAVIASGTSLHGLYDGVIGQPLRQADTYVNPLQLSHRLYTVDVLGLACATAYWIALRRRPGEPGKTWYAVWSGFAIAVGVAMALSVTGQVLLFNAEGLAGYQFSMDAFIWVGLIATVPGERSDTGFARLLLPLLAVLQTLHAYPVAGSQMWLSNLLLVPVGALCVANGVRGLAWVTEVAIDRLALTGVAIAATIVLGWFSFSTFLREPLDKARTAYDDGVPLDLPGSHDIHLSTEEVEKYTEITKSIDENCDALVMEPGMDSFYLWTAMEPPSLTATGWETLFDDEKQEQVIDDIKPLAGLCLLRNNGIQQEWGFGDGPLVAYLEHGFKQIGGAFGYELLRREAPSSSR